MKQGSAALAACLASLRCSLAAACKCQLAGLQGLAAAPASLQHHARLRRAPSHRILGLLPAMMGRMAEKLAHAGREWRLSGRYSMRGVAAGMLYPGQVDSAGSLPARPALLGMAAGAWRLAARRHVAGVLLGCVRLGLHCSKQAVAERLWARGWVALHSWLRPDASRSGALQKRCRLQHLPPTLFRGLMQAAPRGSSRLCQPATSRLRGGAGCSGSCLRRCAQCALRSSTATVWLGMAITIRFCCSMAIHEVIDSPAALLPRTSLASWAASAAP
jgi:hypothetical protein